MRRQSGWFLVLSLGFVVGSAEAGDAPRELSFTDRVAAQRAIERVRYTHQVGTARPFEAAITAETLEHVVRRYLAQSALLEAHGRPITAAMLERELARIARNTLFPEQLLEIYLRSARSRPRARAGVLRPTGARGTTRAGDERHR